MYRGQCLNLKKNTAMVEWALHIAATLEISLLFPHEVFFIKSSGEQCKKPGFPPAGFVTQVQVKSCFILRDEKRLCR